MTVPATASTPHGGLSHRCRARGLRWTFQDTWSPSLTPPPLAALSHTNLHVTWWVLRTRVPRAGGPEFLSDLCELCQTELP